MSTKDVLFRAVDDAAALLASPAQPLNVSAARCPHGTNTCEPFGPGGAGVIHRETVLHWPNGVLEAPLLATMAGSFLFVGILYMLESILSPGDLLRPLPSATRFLAKAAASAVFLFAAADILAASTSVTLPGALMLVALLLCAVGDLFLVMEQTLIHGTITFLLGHLFLALSFLAEGVDLHRCAVSAVVLLPALIACKIFLFSLVPKHMSALIHAYGGAIYLMALLSCGTNRKDLVIAAMLFVVSDVGVSVGTFLKPTWATRASVFLYYAAQSMFALHRAEITAAASANALGAGVA